MAKDEIEIIVKAEIDKALRDFGKLDDTTNKTIKTMSGFGSVLAGVGAILTGTVAVALGKATKLAIDFEEANSKFGTVFKEVSKEANAMRKELVNAFGLSTREATELLSATGDLLSGFGFTGKASLDLSSRVNKLAVDLASFTNAQGGSKAVSEALTKALLGERESLKTYGIAIMEADVQQQLLKEGKQNLTGEALRQAKAEATLTLALSQSKNAIGDYARTQDSMANQLRKMKAIGEDLALVLGSELTKELRPVIAEVSNFVKSANGITVLKSSVQGLFLALKLASLPIKSIIDGFVSMYKVGSLAFDIVKNAGKDVATTFTGIGKSIIGVINVFRQFGSEVFSTFGDIINLVGSVDIFSIKSIRENGAKARGIIRDFKNNIKNDLSDFGSAEYFGSFTDQKAKVKELGSVYVDFAKNRIDDFSNIKKSALGFWNTATTLNKSLTADLISSADTQIAKNKEIALSKEEQIAKEIEAIMNKTEFQRKTEEDLAAKVGFDFENFKLMKNEELLLEQATAEQISAIKSLALENDLISKAEYEKASLKLIQDRMKAEQEKLLIMKKFEDGILQERKNANGIFTQVIIDGIKKAQKGESEVLSSMLRNFLEAIAQKLDALAVQWSIMAFTNPILWGAVAGAVAGSATIRAISPNIKGFQNGTTYADGLPMMVGERGAEMIIPPRGSQVIPSEKSQNISNATINIGQIVANNPEEFASQLDNYLRQNGRIVSV